MFQIVASIKRASIKSAVDKLELIWSTSICYNVNLVAFNANLIVISSLID